MSKGEKWTLVLGILSLALLAISVSIQLVEREEHKAGTMSTIGVVVFDVLAAGLVIWTIYRNLKDAHRAEDLKGEMVTIKDEYKAQIAGLERRQKADLEQAQLYGQSAEEDVRRLKKELLAKDEECNEKYRTLNEQFSHTLEKELEALRRQIPSIGCNGDWIVGPGSFEQETNRKLMEVRGKVISLANDLFAFLREKGPKPKLEPAGENFRLGDEQWKAIRDPWWDYVNSIHYGYQHRFKQRAVDLFNELAEYKIYDNDIAQHELDPPQATRADVVQEIAEHLVLIAAKMDIAHLEKGI